MARPKYRQGILKCSRMGFPTIQELRSSQTHCKNGHEFTPENTRISKRAEWTDRAGQEYRQCRRCLADRERARRKRLNSLD